MLGFQIKTGELAKKQIEAAGGDDSIAKEILDGIKWRLAHDPQLDTPVVDEGKGVHIIKSEKLAPKDPIVTVLYRMLTKDPYYDIEITELRITP